MPGPTRTIGGTGFVSLGDYLGANSGALDSQYNQDASHAKDLGSTYAGYLADLSTQAENESKATGVPVAPGSDGNSEYTQAQAVAQNEHDLSTAYANRANTGTGANPVSGEQSFNDALLAGSHGSDYATLGSALGLDTGERLDSAWNKASDQGAGEYVPPAPYSPPVAGHDPGNAGGSTPAAALEAARLQAQSSILDTSTRLEAARVLRVNQISQ